MEKRDHIIMISLFLVVTVVFLASFNDDFTGNVVATQKISNCYEEDNWKICDVTYSDGTFVEKGFREEVS